MRVEIPAGEFPLAGTVVEVLRQVFGTAYEHRREAWIRRLYELVVELDERGVDALERGQRKLRRRRRTR